MLCDFLICGQGLAGSLLAWRLIKAGADVRIVDAFLSGSASEVSAGIVNPLASRKLRPAWGINAHLPVAVDLYREIEATLGARFFQETPIVRILIDEAQRSHFEDVKASGEADAYLGEELPPGTLGQVQDTFGSFITLQSGWLDVAGLVAALGKHWLSQGRVIEARIIHDEIEPDGNTTRWRGESVGCVVFCEGWRASVNPWFSHVPWNPARGEVLDLAATGQTILLERYAGHILNRGKWLLPLGDGSWRTGSTYEWANFEAGPTGRMRDEILDELAAFVHADFRVTGQRTGVRPVVVDYRPVAGRHLQHSALAILNGLGSRGVVQAPWVSQCLTRHLLDGTPLPAEIDVGRFG